MSAPQALIEFFQQEAIEYLDRLEQLLAASENACPDASAFLTHARALRGSATMTRLEALPDLAATVERIAGGLRDGELRWDQRLHFAVHGALVELRDLVGHANDWTETEQRRSRTQSVALASIAAGYFSPPSVGASSTPVVPISRFFPDDGLPGILERNPNPPCTLPQRFRSDIAAAGALIAREADTLFAAEPSAGQPASTDALRRALLGLSSMGESYGATSIAAISITMARAPLEAASERAAVQALAHLIQDQHRSDQELATRIKDATVGWPGRRASSMGHTPSAASSPAARPPTPLPPRLVIRDLSQPGTPSASVSGTTPRPAAATTRDVAPNESSIVPIESLLYSGASALARAREVRDQLRVVWSDKVGVAIDPTASALMDELSDLLDLAVTH